MFYSSSVNIYNKLTEILICNNQKYEKKNKKHQLKQSIPYNYITYRAIALLRRVFASGPRDQGSIPSRFVSKTQKLVIDAALCIR